MSTMRAFRVVEWGRPAELVDLPVPEPGHGQVRVRVAGCGLCHSDLTMMAIDASVGEALGWQMPFTLGHETAGWVDAVGPGLDAESVPVVGAGVALVSPSSCGACRWCLRGQENACAHGLAGRGYGRDGGLAEYVVVDDPARSLVPLASLDPRIAGPLTDAGATSYHAVRRVMPHLSDDSTAVVIGIGGLGAFVVQILRALSKARIVAVDVDPGRLGRALGLGADHGVPGVDRETSRAVRSIVGADPVDAVVDLVGNDDSLVVGTRLLSPGGALAVVGAGGGTLHKPWFGSLPRDGSVFTFQGSDLADAQGVVRLADEGRLAVDVDPYSLTEVSDAYAAMESGTLGGRAVVRP
jgi:propanol-preferring alcohol dehydrogenase